MKFTNLSKKKLCEKKCKFFRNHCINYRNFTYFRARKFCWNTKLPWSFEWFAMNIEYFTKYDIELTSKFLYIIGSRHRELFLQIGALNNKTKYIKDSSKEALFLADLLDESLWFSNPFTNNFRKLLWKIKLSLTVFLKFRSNNFDGAALIDN